MSNQQPEDNPSQDPDIYRAKQSAQSQKGNVTQVGRDYTSTSTTHVSIWISLILISVLVLGGMGWLLGVRVNVGESGVEIQIQDSGEN